MDEQTQKVLLELVKRNYDHIAEDFSETRSKHLWPELQKLTRDVKDGDSVLDMGCGNGRLLEAFHGKQIDYVGVDNSERLLKIAKEKSTGYKANSINFFVGDILELEKIPGTEFDYVFCIAVLHHIPGTDLHIKALEQIRSKLTPGGKVIITVWNLWSQPKFKRIILFHILQKLLGKHRMDFGDILFKGFKQSSERYYHAFTYSELRKLFKKAELNIEKLYKDDYNYYAILRK